MIYCNRYLTSPREAEMGCSRRSGIVNAGRVQPAESVYVALCSIRKIPAS